MADERISRPSGGYQPAVGVGPLKVLVRNDDGGWFAQGLEIDYVAQGDSLRDVMDRFRRGLTLTIRDHLRRHGHLHLLLRPAPPPVWQRFFDCVVPVELAQFLVTSDDSPLGAAKEDDAPSVHLPFSGIAVICQREVRP